MSDVTTLNIGGPAKDFKIAKTENELIDIIRNNQDLPAGRQGFLVIGGGSNLLVNDSGVDKLVIKNEIAGIEPVILGNVVTPESNNKDSGQARMTLKVKSGTPLQELVDFSITHGLSGLQKLTGIPGTVGGAVFGNAGAYGQTISDCITQVVILGNEVTPESDSGQARLVSDESERARMTLTKEGCQFGYRDSGFKRNHHIILEVTFELTPADPNQLKQEAEEVLSKRLVKYPPGIKCPGSFFKNIVADTLPKEILDKIPPEKIVYGKLPAGSLLEEVGAKGDRLDGIEIAPYHGNLFVNKGGGSAKAFCDLAKKYADLVKQKFGITLEPEVQLISLPPIK